MSPRYVALVAFPLSLSYVPNEYTFLFFTVCFACVSVCVCFNFYNNIKVLFLESVRSYKYKTTIYIFFHIKENRREKNIRSIRFTILARQI